MMWPTRSADNHVKRIELAVRRWFNARFLHNRTPVMVSSASSALPLDDAPSILFLRQDRIGDVLVTTPLLQAVRTRYPRARIDMVLSKNNVGVKHAVAPYTNDVMVYQKTAASLLSIVGKIRKAGYDVVVDLLDNASSTSSMIVAWSGAKYSVGVDKENAGVYTHVVSLLSRDTNHIVQLLMPLGIEPSSVDLRPVYEFTDAEVGRARTTLGLDEKGLNKGGKGLRLGVTLSGSQEGKRLGVEKTIAVVQQIAAAHPELDIYIFGTPGEEEMVERIAAETGANGVRPSGSFHEFAALLHEMSCLWTPDTSTVHLAAAWNVPCCVMYNADTEGRMPWYPYQTHCEALFSDTGTIATMDVADIVQGIERLLAYCAA